MGKQQPQKNLFSFNVDLDERVRANHPLRKVAQKVDFSFVRQEVKDCYGYNGHVGLDPEIILKLMFLLFWDDIRSERELMRMLPERLDYLWFLGYTLDDVVPHHSVLSKARARWGEEVFETLFVRSVTDCVEAGLVEGWKLHMDGSLVDANASKDSVVKASPQLINQLRQAYGAVEAKLDGHLGNPNYERVNRSMLSTTDPDTACVSRKKHSGGGESRPRYKNHRAVDDKVGVITASSSTPGDLDEATQVETLVEQHEANCGGRARAVIADSQYGTAEVMRQLQCRGIRSHMALHSGNKCKNPEISPKTDFKYKPEQNVYICPAGENLYPRRYDKRRKATEYKAYKKVCASCHLRAACTTSKNGRTIMRHLGEELIAEAKEQSSSPAAKRDRIRRRYLMEGSFAQGANLHHFKRSRWRRLHRQRIQDWLICSIQNIKILITHGLPSNTPAEGLPQVKVRLKNLYAGLRTSLLAPFKRQDRLKSVIACSLDCQPIG